MDGHFIQWAFELLSPCPFEASEESVEAAFNTTKYLYTVKTLHTLPCFKKACCTLKAWLISIFKSAIALLILKPSSSLLVLGQSLSALRFQAVVTPKPKRRCLTSLQEIVAYARTGPQPVRIPVGPGKLSVFLFGAFRAQVASGETITDAGSMRLLPCCPLGSAISMF